MAVKVDGEKLDFSNTKKEELIEITEYTDEFTYIENDSKKLSVDMRKVDFSKNEMNIAINNHIGTMTIVVPDDTKVICNIENEYGTIINKTSNNKNGPLVINGFNNLGKVVISYNL